MARNQLVTLPLNVVTQDGTSPDALSTTGLSVLVYRGISIKLQFNEHLFLLLVQKDFFCKGKECIATSN